MEHSTFLHHTGCERCGSSDANAVYDNHTTYCFSCNEWDKIDADDDLLVEDFKPMDDISNIRDYEVAGFRDRKIKKLVTDFFDVRVKRSGEDIVSHYYPFTRDGEVVAYKERVVEGKKFKTIGDFKELELFGQSKFSSGRKLVITEGEIDAMAVAQANMDTYGKIYPVVSIPNGSSSVKKAILNNRDWIRSFDEVILMFDQDEPGKKAANEAARIIGADKVKIAKLKSKDASDSYLSCGDQEIQDQTFNAAPWQPSGVVNAKDVWEEYVSEREAVYIEWAEFLPLVNNKIFGRRTGSITMITSGTGCGKSQFCREDIYHILNNTNDSVGIVSLEESVAETVRGLISIELNTRVGLPNAKSDEKAEKKAFDRLFNDGRVLMLDHQGSVSDSSLTDKLEYLAAAGCKYIYLDHITIAVSESEGNVNTAIDKLMSDILKICKRFDCWFGVVSHLRKTGMEQSSFEEGGNITMDDLRGSGSLKQISAQIFALSRNQKADDEIDRHTVKVYILKDRWSGNTGYAGDYSFDQETGRLHFAKKSDPCSGLVDLT